jgi:hypothetical protein
VHLAPLSGLDGQVLYGTRAPNYWIVERPQSPP